MIFIYLFFFFNIFKLREQQYSLSRVFKILLHLVLSVYYSSQIPKNCVGNSDVSRVGEPGTCSAGRPWTTTRRQRPNDGEQEIYISRYITHATFDWVS